MTLIPYAKKEGKKPGGRPPAPPSGGVDGKEQINLTDEKSRIMPVAGGGFDQCYNAQAVVAAGGGSVPHGEELAKSVIERHRKRLRSRNVKHVTIDL